MRLALLIVSAGLVLAAPAAAMPVEAPLSCAMDGSHPVLTNPGPRTIRAGATAIIVVRSGARTQTVTHRLANTLAPGDREPAFNILLVLDPRSAPTCTAVARWNSPADIYVK